MPAFQLEFKPVALVDENIGIYQYVAKKKPRYFKVLYIEAIPSVFYDFGGLAAETANAANGVEVPNAALYFPNLEMGQYLIIPIDDVHITVKQPLAKSRWVTKGTTPPLERRMLQYEPLKHMNIGQLFIFEDQKAFFRVVNPLKYPVLKSRVWFPGFRFVLEELDVKPAKYTWVPVEGW